MTANLDAQKDKEELARELFDRAVRLWGRGRAQAIRLLIEQTADQVWNISQNPPDREEEPAFFLGKTP